MTMISYRCIRIQWMYQMFDMIYYGFEQCINGYMKDRIKERKNGDNYYDQDGFLITEDYVAYK